MLSSLFDQRRRSVKKDKIQFKTEGSGHRLSEPNSHEFFSAAGRGRLLCGLAVGKTSFGGTVPSDVCSAYCCFQAFCGRTEERCFVEGRGNCCFRFCCAGGMSVVNRKGDEKWWELGKSKGDSCSGIPQLSLRGAARCRGFVFCLFQTLFVMLLESDVCSGRGGRAVVPPM